jgi:hypothetical protein
MAPLLASFASWRCGWWGALLLLLSLQFEINIQYEINPRLHSFGLTGSL